jgi:hypothetical protein
MGLITLTMPVRVISRSRSNFIAANTMAQLRHSSGNRWCWRCFSDASRDSTRYEAVVVGAGPAGIAVVGNLLEQKKAPILWVDDKLQGGRLNKYYREVPRYVPDFHSSNPQL